MVFGAESLLAASLLAGANYADLRTTRAALAGCPTCYEANPLIGRGGERLVPLKVVAVAAQTAVFVGLRKRHRKTAWVFVAGVVGANLAIARHNAQAGRKMSDEGLTMTPAQRVAHHAACVRAAIAQAREVGRLGWPEPVGAMVDRLAYDHARAAAHEAGRP